MNRFAKFASIAATVAIVAMSFLLGGCGKTPGEKPHEHQWKWVRTETEHSATCMVKGCKAILSGRHVNKDGEADGSVTWLCEECAEFKALALGFTSGGDSAHADFANEANVWFPEQAKKYGFIYDFTTDFGAVNTENLKNYDVVILLNNRPSASQMPAFKKFMDDGGGCLAFHAAGFAMWNSEDPDVPEAERPFIAPNEWEDWFQNTFLRSGVYGYCPRVGRDTAQGDYYWNTWNPTSELMTVETHDHFATANLDDEFMSAPCEWYEWHNDLFHDDDATVLVTMNPTEQDPAGDDNRPSLAHQIWKDGCHPIAWANNSYNMVYMNWGHNLQPYNIDTGSPVGESETFSSAAQCQFTLDALFGVAGREYVKIDYAGDLED